MSSGKDSRIEQGISRNKPPLLKPGQYEWWSGKMTDWIKAEDGKCWLIILHDDNEIPKVPGATVTTELREKTPSEYKDADIAIMEKNAKAHLLISNALSMEDSSNVSIFPTAKEMWNALKSMKEGTEDLKRSKIFNLLEDLSSL